jgi:hypothetical protein
VLAATAALAGSLPAQSPENIIVHGRVVSSGASDAVRNAVVRAGEPDGGPVATDADGRFTLTTRRGTTLTATKTGFAPATTDADEASTCRSRFGCVEPSAGVCRAAKRSEVARICRGRRGRFRQTPHVPSA